MLDWDGFKLWHCFRKVTYHDCVFFFSTEDLCGLIFNIGCVADHLQISCQKYNLKFFTWRLL